MAFKHPSWQRKSTPEQPRKHPQPVSFPQPPVVQPQTAAPQPMQHREVPSAPPLPGGRPRPVSRPVTVTVPKPKDPLPNLRPMTVRPVAPQTISTKPSTQSAAVPLPDKDEREERLEYLRNINDSRETKRKKSKKKKIFFVIVLLLLFLGGAAAGGYWFYENRPVGDNNNATNQSTAGQQTTPADDPAPIDTVGSLESGKSKEYSSSVFPVTLTYADNWDLKESAEALTITSPKVKLTGADGQPTDAAIVFMLKNKQTDIPAFGKGSALAVLASERITYTAPAAGQRGQTYISFLQYKTTTTQGALDAIHVTGNKGYQKGQSIPETDLLAVDPYITVSFVSCTSACLATAPPLPVSNTVWNDTTIKKAIEDLLKSLAIS